MKRRDAMKWLSAAALLPLLGRAAQAAGKGAPRVVIVGAGFGGATAAKYIRLWEPGIEVILIERGENFVSCPLSNLVVAGSATLDQITTSYAALEKNYAIRLIHDEATAIDPDKKTVRLRHGDDVPYDRLIVAPGVDIEYDEVPGLETSEARSAILHAWKAGPQTLALRGQLERMADGGVFAITIPKAPYRCPPGPYERASLVAHYVKQRKPKSRVIVLDANAEIVSKKALFTQAWAELYPETLEYRPNSELTEVIAAARTAKFQFEDVQADVLNVIPPQRAGTIARDAGLITANKRWCEVDFLTFESKVAPNVHVLGDAILAAPAMPKSAFMANNQAKVAADSIIALLTGKSVNANPVLANTCYSYVSASLAIHVASVHRFDPEKKTFLAVQGAGGVSAERNQLEADYAWGWAKNIWADTLR
jgi:NADPH-dependent 2,4-dienoyl-CoA reductase/sulfur reductase-like enzyme